MNIPVLVMRDANWSPDLPTAACVAEALYKSDVGLDIDGIVTIDLHVVRRIFTALGEFLTHRDSRRRSPGRMLKIRLSSCGNARLKATRQ